MGNEPVDAGLGQLASGGPEMRASDADRDKIAGLVNTAFVEGRLTADEHDQRLSSVYAARTWRQLRLLTADLPAAKDVAAKPAARHRLAGPDPCLLCVLLIVCPPAGLAWWLQARRPASDPPGSRLDYHEAGWHAKDR